MKLGILEHSFVQIGYIPTYPEIEAAKQKSLMASMKGFEGPQCNKCENYKLTRNGIMLECAICGNKQKKEKEKSDLPELPEISGNFQIKIETWNTAQKTSDTLLGNTL